jgi:SAM-dependent methyltransferase
MSAHRDWLRMTFDDAPEVFDRTRPVCPPQLFDDLTALAQLPAGARLLEIGCGTGQATVPLAERGYAIVALEIGPRLAEFARRKLAAFPNLKIVNAAFEAWDAAGARFAGIIAFNAFHWLDPDVRYAKAAQLLRAGGALVLVGTRFVLPDDAEPFWTEMQEDYAAIHGGPPPDRPPHPDAVGDLRGEIEASGSFHTVAVRRYLWNVRYTADEYISLLSTASWHRQLDAESRRDLFERLRRRIVAQPEGAITATLLATLHIAQLR